MLEPVIFRALTAQKGMSETGTLQPFLAGPLKVGLRQKPTLARVVERRC